MSLRTVKGHIQSMRKKTGFRNRTELAVRAREGGLVINNKELFGYEFYDYNLVFCNANGRPIENQVIICSLQKLIRENDFRFFIVLC